MKKRFLIPAVTVALFGLAALGSQIDNQDLAKCNEGDISACDKVSTESNKAEIVNQTWLAAQRKARKAEQQRKAAEAAKPWQPTKENTRMLAFACEQRLKPALKDPASFRELDSGMSNLTDTHVTVFVRYTATNSYGGRIQDIHECTYTR